MEPPTKSMAAQNEQPDTSPLSDRSNSRSPSPHLPVALASSQAKPGRSPPSLPLVSSDDDSADEVSTGSLAANQNAAAQNDQPKLSIHQDAGILASVEIEQNHDNDHPFQEAGPARVTSVQFKNRPYGRPLSTILERSSYATLRSKISHSSSKRRFTPVHVDSESKYLHTEITPIEGLERVKAFSFDESILCDARHHLSDGSSEQLSSNPTLRPSLEDTIAPSLPPFEPPYRVNTPDGLPRWPNDERARPRRRHLRRRSNPILALSGFIRRASASNERSRHGIWRPLPGTGTPGFDGLEHHPFSAARRFPESLESPARQSLSLTLRTRSSSQPMKPRKVSRTNSRQSLTTFPATASLPRSIEIRNNRRAAASEETSTDAASNSRQSMRHFPSPTESLRRSASGEALATHHSVPPPSPVLVPQQPPTDDAIAESPLELSEALHATEQASSPLADRETALPRPFAQAHQRPNTWNEESPPSLSRAVRGDLQHRYAQSGVPIYRTDAASDRSVPRDCIELHEPSDHDNADEFVITPERQCRNQDDLASNPEQDTSISTPRDVAAASLSSRHLYTSPAISNVRRAQQPSAATPILLTSDGSACQEGHLGETGAENRQICPHQSRSGARSQHIRNPHETFMTQGCLRCRLQASISRCLSWISTTFFCRPRRDG